MRRRRSKLDDGWGVSQFRNQKLIDLPEHLLVRYLATEVSRLYEFFDFVLRDGLGEAPRDRAWDYIFFAELPREYLGLRPGQPGDIDVVIVPTFNDEPCVEYAAAIEVKRLALRGPNWNKNVDRYGITQAKGLLRAGFPYVGILHIVLCEDGPAENWKELHQYEVYDEERQLIRFVRAKMTDMTPTLAAERQYHRLLAQKFEGEIGINCVAVSQFQDETGSWLFGSTMPNDRPAKRNPRPHPLLLRNLAEFVEQSRPYTIIRPADTRKSAERKQSN